MPDTELIRLDVGLYDNVTAAAYHADPALDPSLSSSIAKVLVDQTARHAWDRHPRLNPNYEPQREEKFILGSVAHELILGRGAGVEVLDFGDWRKDAARTARDKAWTAGKTPVLAYQYETALLMAQAVCARLQQIEACAPLLNGEVGESMLSNGTGESVAIWREPGVMCRSMIDWIGPRKTDIWDLKTTGNLSDESLSRQIWNFGYDLSAAFYLRGLETLFPELAGRFRWRWIFVEDSHPHEVRVIEPAGQILAIGARKAAIAIDKWRRATESGLWPGYPREVQRLGLPGWAEAQWLEREAGDLGASLEAVERVARRDPLAEMLDGGAK